MYEILATGSATADDLLFVDRFPTPDSKQEVLREERHGGGLAATAAVAAARLGVPTAYADALGDDDLSRWVIADLEREGLDTSMIARVPGARPIHAVIIVEQGSGARTILYTTEGQAARDAVALSPAAIAQARVLCIDDVRLSSPAWEAALRAARAAGVQIVADFELRHDPALLALIDHLIVPAAFATRVTGLADPARAARALWTAERAAVVVTCGAAGAWYYAGEGEAQHQAAFPVQAVDTTGCGDVFHGAYAAALTWRLGLAERVRLASACAALKATQAGGRQGIPTRRQVEAFLGV